MIVAGAGADAGAVTVTKTDTPQDTTISSYFSFRAILHRGQVAGVAGSSSLGTFGGVFAVFFACCPPILRVPHSFLALVCPDSAVMGMVLW